MTATPNLDRVRGETLDRIERGERNVKLAVLGAAVVEALLLGSFLLAADFSNRIHLLLLISTVAIYTILGLGLIALGAHVNRNTRILLKAIEMVERR
ncbi:MAG: hypothetical protein QOF89_523 [Acidobacteriota bacterium]|jgi:hypothetical protein|nr:hypothetical protein [Acidobacteriota bacterium]